MARSLIFKINGNEYPAVPTKVERRKLYGWTELFVTDSEGKQCRQAAINSDGVTIIDQGATKTGIFSEDGMWVNREELVAVRNDGSIVEQVESSFDTGCLLDTLATIDELLNLNVSSVYQLSVEEGVSLAEKIGADIYKFPFNYRGGYASGMAFLVSNNAGIFMLTGSPADIEFIGLEETGFIDDTEDFDIDDDLDFGMM